ncbi:porin [Sneathiella sp. HT1-7]|uniref:porin n=1 Tax=Sneathiella sp. HT1-7 TaxID=2887192 RepID=UPI001D15488F|nr:porin [Sneathiella sp. HT1-7]MCC3303988.1 porin [Sneathiella sp. HT1-7]
MKKAILGTTALVAVGALAAAPASASEKIALGVGGYMQSTYFYQSSDEPAGTPDRTSDRVTQEGEIFFTGSTTLDNGLKFGVNVQLEAYEATDQVDETYIYVQGSFGRVLLGSEDSAAYLMHYTSPSPVPMYSADSANIYPTGQGNTTRPNMFSDSDKITYFTPRFAGFQLGASYIPDGSSQTGTGESQYAAPSYDSGTDRGWSVAANYVNKFGSVDVAASAAYQQADTTVVVTAPVYAFNPGTGGSTLVTAAVTGDGDDYEEYAFGVSIGVAGFTVGGGYGVDKNISGVSDNDSKAWSAGVKYGMGPWAVGVQYSKTTFEPAAGGDTDQTTWLVGGQYTLGPGITAFGGWQYDDNDLAASSATRMAGDTSTFFVGTALSF